MSNLEIVFKEISKNKIKLAASPNGATFEENFKQYLRKYGFNEISKNTMDDELKLFLAKIKKDILNKDDTMLLGNSLYKRTLRKDFADFYIWQPYGSQDFPDFLVFSQNSVFAIETKFSKEKQSKPMWNSNIPKKNSIYIFANHEFLDLTYFLGHDVISDDERAKLLALWEQTDKEYTKWADDFNKKIKDGELTNNYGFTTYSRRAYDQGKKHNKNAILDFFKNKNRADLENNVISFISLHS